MIDAEIHGKLGRNYSHAHERAEDLLTSTVFGLLRYIPPADGFLAVLRRVRSVNSNSFKIQQDANWFDDRKVVEVKVEFWPHWRGYGEPDVLLTLQDAVGDPVVVVLVEAKLDAPKSGRAREDDELTDEAIPDPDQLVRYWQGLQEHVKGKVNARIVYLTKHGPLAN